MSDEIEKLAYVVLQTANRLQAKGSTVRIVAPRDPEVTYKLGMDPEEDGLLTAVEYLLEQGYVVPAGIALPRGAYTIAPAGLEWLEVGATEPLEAPETAAEPGFREEPFTYEERAQEAEQSRSWWSRLFGG